MLRPSILSLTILCLFQTHGVAAISDELRKGVWTGTVARDLPLPTRGYQVYMVGEMHGLEENADFQLQYLRQLYESSSLRDVAIEEDAVYEEAAQSFVDGTSAQLPPALCLRAEILQGIRLLNSRLDKRQRIRVHLTDIDSPADAIRQHLEAIVRRAKATQSVSIPAVQDIKEQGLDTVRLLRRFSNNGTIRAELRTIEHSIKAFQQGLEIGTGRSKGSPYLEDREQAVASNIEDLLKVRKVRSLLVVYGADHVSKSDRRDGGPDRDQPLSPVAKRLERAGLNVFSVVTFPLAGQSSWRGEGGTLLWNAADGHLSTGETLDQLLLAASQAKMFYINPEQERVSLPSQDISNFGVDGFVLFPSATALRNQCETK